MMKKLLLLALTGITALQGFAQTNSVVFTRPKNEKEAVRDYSIVPRHSNANSATKGTATGGSGWFSYTAIMATTSSTYYNNPMAQDSNIIVTYANGNFGIGSHGFGMSFDPTDSAYFSVATSASQAPNTDYLPPIVVMLTNPYNVDSIGFPFKYKRHDNTHTDTLTIELIKVPRSGGSIFGVYKLNFQNSLLPNVSPAPWNPSFVSAIYNPANSKLSDSIPSGNKVVITKILDAAFAADTNANGYSNWALGLPVSISASAGDMILAYVSMQHQFTYPVGTLESAGNYSLYYTFDLSGNKTSPKQNVYSSQCGLVASSQNLYHASASDTDGFHYSGHNILIPSIAYTQDGRTTDFAFHINCATCVDLKVANVSGIKGTSVYPNPANTELNISFSLKNAANVNVSLTNAVGQVLETKTVSNSTNGKAVFNTANLANGIYFYTVEANGERSTGRVVVAH